MLLEKFMSVYDKNPLGNTTRQQLRQIERDTQFIKRKLYSYQEVVDISQKVINTEVQAKSNEMREKFTTTFTSIIAMVLNSEYKFGKKRIGNVLQLLFEQIEGVANKTIEPELIIEEAKKLGINFKYENGKLITVIDSTPKNVSIEPTIIKI